MLKLSFLSRVLNRKGQSIVEMALITPLLLVALYVPADFGVAFSVAHLTQNAVRESARIAAATDPFTPSASNAIRTDALSRLPAWFGATKTATVRYYEGPATDCARIVEVEGGGTYNYFFYQLLRLFGGTAPNNRTITRTARMRYGAQPATYHTPCTTVAVSSPSP